jgi:hypothetical protein
MTNILNELIADIISLGEVNNKKPKIRASKNTKTDIKPSNAKFTSGGKWYTSDPTKGGEYVGRIEKGTWVPATAAEKAAEKTIRPQVEPTQQTKSNKVDVAKTEPSKYSTEESSWLSSQVFGNVFSTKSKTISRGKAQIKIRPVINPKTGEEINTSTPTGRMQALAVINAQLQTLDKPIKDACSRLTKKGTENQLQRIKKFLGNVGELYTLRELLASGVEAYLLPDSYPKNDVAILLPSGNDRGVDVFEISVKSSTGTKVGALGSNARIPLHSAVDDKTLNIAGGDYLARDAIDASMFVYSQMMRFATEGHIVGEKREIVIKQNKLGNFDKETAKTAIQLSREGKKGAQDLLLKARKLTQNDLINFKNSPLFAGLEKTPEHQKLVDYYIQQLSAIIAKNPNFRLSDTKNVFTNQIVDILEKTDSSLAFESDLVAVKFSEQTGFENITITPAEVMLSRAGEKVGDIQSMSILDQLNKLGNFRLGTRGLNTHNPKTRAPMGGYAGAIINLAPPTDILNDEDKLSAAEYVRYIQQQSTPQTKVK